MLPLTLLAPPMPEAARARTIGLAPAVSSVNGSLEVVTAEEIAPTTLAVAGAKKLSVSVPLLIEVAVPAETQAPPVIVGL